MYYKFYTLMYIPVHRDTHRLAHTHAQAYYSLTDYKRFAYEAYHKGVEMRSDLGEVQLRCSLGLLKIKTEPKCEGQDLRYTHRIFFFLS